VPGLLEDLPRSGRPKQISEAKEDSILQATLRTTPKDATHWSTRTMAATQGVSPATVHRIWQKHKLQPHRSADTHPDILPSSNKGIGLSSILISTAPDSFVCSSASSPRAWRSWLFP
jgi:hypothetical protein